MYKKERRSTCAPQQAEWATFDFHVYWCTGNNAWGQLCPMSGVVSEDSHVVYAASAWWKVRMLFVANVIVG